MKKINEDIYWVGTNDRTTDLFEGVWPIPRGVSYNTYLIDDEKTALIDSIEQGYEEDMLEKIEKVTNPSEIDYLIVNHMEPDHSGALPILRRVAPDAEIICTEKALGFLESFYGITENIRTVETGDSLKLGERTLKFFEIPFVHWPETMVTYETNDKILFSCDAFGTFGAIEGDIFDSETEIEDRKDDILRYFSNIVGMYSSSVQAALKKLEGVEVEMIAPSHGPVWKNNAGKIIETYDKWSSLKAEAGVTIIYGTMYGMSEKMMEAVAEGVKSSGCQNLEILDASRVPLSNLLSEAWKRKGLIIGSPTYDARVFPPVSHFIDLAKRKKLRDRIAGAFGSYGWSGGALDRIKSAIDDMDWELVEPIAEFRGKPTEEETEKGKELGKTIGEKVTS